MEEIWQRLRETKTCEIRWAKFSINNNCQVIMKLMEKSQEEEGDVLKFTHFNYESSEIWGAKIFNQ